MNLLVISGGEHPYHESTPALADFLRGDGHEVMATEDASVLASDGMGAYDVLIFNTRRSGDLTLAEDEQAALTRSVGDGKGFVAIHCGASRPETWHEFHDVTGGGWIGGVSSHPPYGKFTVNVKDAGHPCAREIADFVTDDELYTNLGWKPGNEVFLSAELDGVEHPMAWTRRFGKGKVFTTMLGHDGLSFQTPEFQRLILNAVGWVSSEG